jgi:hypothetical protein
VRATIAHQHRAPLPGHLAGDPLPQPDLGDRRVVADLRPEQQPVPIQQIDAEQAIAEALGQATDQRRQQTVDLVLACQQRRERVERRAAVVRASRLRAVAPERFEPFGGDPHRRRADREAGDEQHRRLEGIRPLPGGQRQGEVGAGGDDEGDDGERARIGDGGEPEPEEEEGEGRVALTDQPQHDDAADPEEEDRQCRLRREARPGHAPERDQRDRAERGEGPAGNGGADFMGEGVPAERGPDRREAQHIEVERAAGAHEEEAQLLRPIECRESAPCPRTERPNSLRLLRHQAHSLADRRTRPPRVALPPA